MLFRSVAMISLSGKRSAKFYRDSVSQKFPTVTAANRSAAMRYGMKLISKDLPQADRIMDKRLNEYAAALTAGTEVPVPKFDLDWSKAAYDKDYIRSHFSSINADADPLLVKIENKALNMRAEIVDLANRLAKGLKNEHHRAQLNRQAKSRT